MRRILTESQSVAYVSVGSLLLVDLLSQRCKPRVQHRRETTLLDAELVELLLQLVEGLVRSCVYVELLVSLNLNGLVRVDGSGSALVSFK